MRAADATPGRGDCWILKITHAPSPKNLSKNGFCPRKGVAFLWKAFLQKNFQVRISDIQAAVTFVAMGQFQTSAALVLQPTKFEFVVKP